MTSQDKKEPAYSDLDYPPFGKYAKGKPDCCMLQDVPASYLLWLYEQIKVKHTKNEGEIKLMNYIHNSMDALKLENKDRV